MPLLGARRMPSQFQREAVVHDKSTWPTNGIKKGVNNSQVLWGGLVLPVHVNQLLSSGHVLFKVIEFCLSYSEWQCVITFSFKIEICIKIRTLQGRKSLFPFPSNKGLREEGSLWTISDQQQLLQQGKMTVVRDSFMPTKERLITHLIEWIPLYTVQSAGHLRRPR